MRVLIGILCGYIGGTSAIHLFTYGFTTTSAIMLIGALVTFFCIVVMDIIDWHIRQQQLNEILEKIENDKSK